MHRKALSTAAALLVLACVAPAAPKEPMQVPTTVAAFDKIVEQLKAEAEAFLKANDDKGPTLSPALKRVQYTEECAQPLAKALKDHRGGTPEDLYIACQLVQPLKMAGDEAIRPTRPALVQLLNAHCRYKPMPRWPQGTVATLNPPPSLPADQLLKLMPKINELRREKAKAERPIVKHNRTVRQLEGTIKRLLAMLGDASADEILLKRLVAEEQSKLVTYEDTLAAIKAEAENMKQPRAKKMYEQLKAIALRGGHRKNYLDPTQPNYSITGNSGFHSQPYYFGVSALQVVNILATFAKEPAVPIPDVKKYEGRR